MTKIRRWPEYYSIKKDNEGRPTLSQDAFLSSQLNTKYREKALDEYYEQDMKDSGIEIVGTYVIFIDSYLYYSSEIYCYVHIIA
jgi:hypothetical protein